MIAGPSLTIRQLKTLDNYEIMLRGLLDMPNKPAVLYIEVFQMMFSTMGFGADLVSLLIWPLKRLVGLTVSIAVSTSTTTFPAYLCVTLSCRKLSHTANWYQACSYQIRTWPDPSMGLIPAM